MTRVEREKQITELRADAYAAYARRDYDLCKRLHESVDWCEAELEACIQIYDNYRSEGQSHAVSAQYAGLL
jgi:hypothetical protein